MKYEFIIRHIKSKEDLRKIVNVPDDRFDIVLSKYQLECERLSNKDQFNRGNLVILINEFDDDGNFNRVVQ